jgi:hypothetical protein
MTSPLVAGARVATIVFVYRLKAIGYELELAWPPLAAIAGALIGGLAIAWPAAARRQPVGLPGASVIRRD